MKTLRPVAGSLALALEEEGALAVARGLELAGGDAREVGAAARTGPSGSTLRSFCHGQTKSERTAISSSTGQLIRSTGRTKRLSGTPLANQIVISLARYMRDSVATTAMNSDSASIVEQMAEADVGEQQHHVLRRDPAAAPPGRGS